MFKSNFRFINEEFRAVSIAPEQMDRLLADGWRHFGAHFFRYSIGITHGELRFVIPLRVRLAGFALSKSQRRVVRRNQDLQTIIRPIVINDEKHELFARHKNRFKEGIPDSLFDFLAPDAANVPCENLEAAVYDGEKLLAASFFDVGATTVSAVYAMFEPSETRRSLGIYTMLATIDFAARNGKDYYYPGYAYEGNSFYDYKKRFSNLERYDWQENWTNYTAE